MRRGFACVPKGTRRSFRRASEGKGDGRRDVIFFVVVTHRDARVHPSDHGERRSRAGHHASSLGQRGPRLVPHHCGDVLCTKRAARGTGTGDSETAAEKDIVRGESCACLRTRASGRGNGVATRAKGGAGEGRKEGRIREKKSLKTP